MVDFQNIVDECFETFGKDATYTPAGGSPVPDVKIIPNQPDTVMDFEVGRSIHQSIQIDVRESEVPGGPSEGDELVIGAKTFRIVGDARADEERLVWSFPVKEVAP